MTTPDATRTLVPTLDRSLAFTTHGMLPHEIQAARGVLICLVVFGHIRGSSPPLVYTKIALYDFHVMGFLLISMLRPVGAFSWAAFTGLVRRCLGLLLPMTLIAFIGFNLFITGDGVDALASKLPIYLLALTTGNFMHLDQSTGLELFWFMYALAGLTTLRMIIHRFGGRTVPVALTLFVLAIIGGLSSLLFWKSVPAWIGIAAYFLPLGVIVFGILNALLYAEERSGAPVLFMSAVVFLTMSVLWTASHSYNIAHLRMPKPWNVPDYLSLALYVALSFHLVMRFARTRIGLAGFQAIGALSLGIYLTHMFFLYPLQAALQRVVQSELLQVLVIFPVVMIASFFASRILLWK